MEILTGSCISDCKPKTLRFSESFRELSTVVAGSQRVPLNPNEVRSATPVFTNLPDLLNLLTIKFNKGAGRFDGRLSFNSHSPHSHPRDKRQQDFISASCDCRSIFWKEELFFYMVEDVSLERLD